MPLILPSRRILLSGAGPDAINRLALYDFDFARSRYKGALLTDLVTARASSGLALNGSGVWQSFAANVPRITNLGLLVEEARTNSVRNNTGSGIVAGTPGTLPPFWLQLSIAAGLTREIVGTSTVNGIPGVVIRISGTPSDANGLALFFEQAGAIAASPGQVYTQSAFVQIVAGSLANVSNLRLRADFRDAGQAALAATEPAIVPTTALQRFASATAAAPANTVSVTAGLRFATTSGQPIDVTFFIGAPQLELGPFATSPILTSGSAVTRAGETTRLPVSLPSEITLYAEFGLDGAPFNNSASRPASLSDLSVNNTVEFFGTGSSLAMNVQTITGAANRHQTAIGSMNASGVNKAAYRAAVANYRGVLNGGAAGTGTGAGAMPVLTHLDVGNRFDGLRPFTGLVRRVAIIPSALSDAQLQAITT